jgi:hypothetical protein
MPRTVLNVRLIAVPHRGFGMTIVFMLPFFLLGDGSPLVLGLFS